MVTFKQETDSDDIESITVTRHQIYNMIESQICDARSREVDKIAESLRQRSHEAFTEADEDQDGFLSQEELNVFLQKVLAELGPEIAEMMGDFDAWGASKDGKISSEEFHDFIFKMEKDNLAAELSYYV